MFCSIESVTVGVGNLESGLQFFRDRLGMRVVNDTRASVGLVAAWRRPVHESVRLVDLASAASMVAALSPSGAKRPKPVPASAKSLPPGRVRLAVYEDWVLTAASRDVLGDKTIPPTSGPWAIELARAGESAADKLNATHGPDGLLVLMTGAVEGLNVATTPEAQSAAGSAPPSSSSPGVNAKADQVAASLSSIWISTSNLTASTRFYTEALGLQSFNDSKLATRLSNGSVNAAQCVAFGSKDNTSPKIVIASVGAPSTEQQAGTSMAVGQLGFNLITMRCDDLDELQKRIEALGIKPITEPAHVGMPFGYPSRVMIVPGPNGELFEFDEIVV